MVRCYYYSSTKKTCSILALYEEGYNEFFCINMNFFTILNGVKLIFVRNMIIPYFL